MAGKVRLGNLRFQRPIVVQPASGSATAPVAPADYIWGTHAQAIYNAEAQKSQFVRPATPSATPKALGTYVATAQQQYVDVQAVTIAPSRTATPAASAVRSYFAGPFDFAYTPSSVTVAPLITGQGAVPPYTQAAPQPVDLALQATYAKPLIIGQGRVPPYVSAAPQNIDLTLPAAYSVPLVGARGPVPPMVVAAPQFIDLSVQAFYAKPLIIGQGAVPPYVFASQADPTQIAAQTWASLVAPPITSGFLGAYQSTQSQFEERATKQFVPAAVAGQTTPVIPRQYAAPQLFDFTLAASITAPSVVPPPPASPVPLRHSFSSPQFFDFTLAPSFSSPTVAPTAPPNKHRLVIDVENGRIGWMVSGTHTGSPIVVQFF